MKRHPVLFYMLIVLMTVLWGLCSCNKKEAEKSAIPPPPEKLGKLNVVMGIPSGSVTEQDELDTVTVTFNQPMAPLTTVPQDESTGPLRFEPPLKGKYRWVGTSTLQFTPREPLPGGMTVKATVPAGTKSLFGAVLEKDFEWTFETLRPQLRSSVPSEKQEWISLDSSILLMYNMPMDPARTAGAIKLISIDGKGSKKDVDFTARSGSSKDLKFDEKWRSDNVLVLTPKAPMNPSYKYRVIIPAGLKAREGDLGSLEDAVVNFSTVNIFGLVRSSLPRKQDPDSRLELRFTNPIYYKDLAKNISFSPAIKLPDYYEENDYETASPELYIRFSAQTEYRVIISKNLKDMFGNALPRDETFTFRTTDFAPSVSLTTGTGVVEALSRRQLPVSFLNVNKVKLQMARVDRNRVIPMHTGDAFHYDRLYNPGGSFFGVDKMWENRTPRNEERFLPIELSEALGTDQSGFVFVQIDNLLDSRKSDRYQKAFIQVTNLGITAKFSPENGVVWVTELSSTKPVKGADVELRDDGNRVLWKGKTDERGIANTKGRADLGLHKENRWSKPTIWVFASKDKDCAFINSSWDWGISPYSFNLDYDYDPDDKEFKGDLYTEKGLYKPGDQVKVKGVFREKKLGKWIISSVKKLVFKVRNSRNEVVFKTDVKLSGFGSFDVDVPIKEGSPTGHYAMQLYIGSGKSENQVAYDSFRVEEYVPADFKVTVNSDRDSYIFQDTFRGSVKGWYLFGAPMANDKVSWKLRLSPFDFTPKGCDEYLFGPMDYENSEDSTILLGSGDGKLARDGTVNVSTPLNNKSVTSTMMLIVEGSVKSANRVELYGEGSYVVHKGEYYIGVKPLSTFGSVKKPQSVEIITVTPEGKKKGGQKLRVEIARRIWHSIRKVGIYGSREWITEKKDEPVKSYDIRTTEQPVKIDYTPEKAGYYVVKVSGIDTRQNSIYSEAGFYASGDDYVAWERQEDDMIQLVKDKEKYRPGDKARIIVKSPYENARALITYEREYIINRQVKELKGSTPVIEFDVYKDDLPNIFVSVVLIQGRVAEEKFSPYGEDLGKPSFKIGYVNIPVVTDDKKLKVAVSSDRENYKPGEKVKVTLKLNDNNGKPVAGEVSLAVVDVGVLSLIDYQTPNFFDAFYGPRSLRVDTAEERLHIIGQRDFGEKGENSGGGGGADLSAFSMRSNFKDTPYWNPSIITNNAGEAIVNFTLPDNLTTFRLMAVAATKDSNFGSGQSEIVVAKPLLLKPSHPRFARLHDSFQAGVMVFNGTKEKGDVMVMLENQGLTIDGPSSKTVSINAGEEKEVLFNLKADRVEKGVLKFAAKMGSESDGLICEIPVSVPVLTEAVATSGDLDRNEKQESIEIPQSVDPLIGSLEVSTSSTALVGLKGGIDYLINYPYECLEQKISRILPAVMAQDLVEAFNLSSSLKGREYRDFIQSYLDVIEKYQKSNGGLGYWPDSEYENEYLTCYTLYAMAMAKKAGYRVNEKVADKGLRYLRSLLTGSEDVWKYYYDKDAALTIKSYALYDLYLWGRGDPSYIPLLFKKKSAMSLFGEAMLLKAIHIEGKHKDMETSLINSFMNRMKLTPTTAHFEDRESPSMRWILNSNVRTTALLLQALLEVKAEFPEAPRMARWLAQAQKNGRWNTTQENVFAYDALRTYFKIYESDVPDFVGTVMLGNEILLKNTYKGRQLEVKSAEKPMKDMTLGKAMPLSIERKGKGRMYYTFRLRYAPLDKIPCRDEGMAVFKTIEPIDQVRSSDGTFKAGAVYKVTLSVVTPQERTFVVVNDPLPGGFTAVNTEFATEKAELLRKLGKIRASEKKGLWGGTFNHFETYNDRMLLFADILTAGEHRFTYFVRALHFGTYSLPNTKAEMMYEPEVFGYSESRSVEIK